MLQARYEANKSKVQAYHEKVRCEPNSKCSLDPLDHTRSHSAMVLQQCLVQPSGSSSL